MKTCSVLTRRAGITPRAFRTYYEEIHAPLARRFLPFRKYVRNHVIAASKSIDFDVIMESWFDDGVNPADAVSPDERALLDIDLRNFARSERIRSAHVEERTLWGTAPDSRRQGWLRQMVLLSADFSDPRVAKDVACWAARLGSERDATGVSIDIVLPGANGRGVFPCQAVLSLWFEQATEDRFADGPYGIKVHDWMLAQVCEPD